MKLWLLVAVFAALEARAQEAPPLPKPAEVVPARLRFRAPEDTVAEYAAASRARDEERMARTYLSPVDRMGVATARFRKAHQALLKETRERFGADGVKVVDDERFHQPDPAVIESHEIIAKATRRFGVRLHLRLQIAGRGTPEVTFVDLVSEMGDWRIAAVGGRAFGIIDGHDKYILEWDVAEEATRRTLEHLQAGRIRGAADVVTMRTELMKTITHDRMTIRKMR